MIFYKFRRLFAYIPAVIVAIFLFSFVHSELGLFNYDHGDHSEHDHCEIVQTTNIPSVSFKVPQPKLEINKFLSENNNLADALNDITNPIGVQNYLAVNNSNPLPVYISHRSLLI
ncbi:MAG: hypothetical protein KBF60_08030 [Ignavibacteriaceae bacterium]|jgi:hypothetical protein|nr:hypothetical protein [Ignavibacteriales bacterium]MBP9123082.1 hypothetical protein [Ignavibacteriaceae bacterium]